METITKESPGKKSLLKIADTLVLIISIALALFHMYSATIGVMPAYEQSAIHWGLIGTYIIITT